MYEYYETYELTVYKNMQMIRLVLR